MQGKSKSSVGAIKNKDGNITNAKGKAESLNHFFSTPEPLQLNAHKIKRFKGLLTRVKPGKGCGPEL